MRETDLSSYADTIHESIERLLPTGYHLNNTNCANLTLLSYTLFGDIILN